MQAVLFSTLAGAVPGPLIWGLVAGSSWGQKGAFLLFSFLPLLLVPLCIILLVRLQRRTGGHFSASPQLLLRAAQAIAVTGPHRQKLLQQAYGLYTSVSATSVALKGSGQQPLRTISKSELYELVVDTFLSARRVRSSQKSREAAEDETREKQAAHWLKQQLPAFLERACFEKSEDGGLRFEQFCHEFPALLDFLLVATSAN